jgi:hypothetical protein
MMVGEDRASPADYGYDDDEHAYLHVCPKCFELYEKDRPDGMNQTCACHPNDPERWPGADFNQHAMMCRCCALNVLASGSRWHPYFCRECQLLAMGVSVWNRRLVIPVGRHSIMHSWVPRTAAQPLPTGQEIDLDELAETLAATLQDISKTTDLLWKWYRTSMKRNLKRFGLKSGVSLREYMEAVVAEKPALSTRLEAFEGLCKRFRSKPRARRG